ncbi:MAG: hypothetical protein QE271_10945 [Bacteriovoracaceae bacterium]|nr:hypothetical protein [Bacteriovoracaceae bacterium]
MKRLINAMTDLFFIIGRLSSLGHAQKFQKDSPRLSSFEFSR